MASQPIPRARLTIKPVSQPVIERAKITAPVPPSNSLDELANNLLTATANRTRVPVRNFLPDWLDKSAKKFQKGKSGNPLGGAAPGAKAKRLIANAYKEMANQIEPLTGMTYAQLLALSMFYQTINRGNVFAAREVREALEGKMSPMMDDTSKGSQADANSAKKLLLQRLIKVSETRPDGTTTTVTVAEQADI